MKKTKAYQTPNNEMYKPEHEMVERINTKQNKWKAKVYPEYEKMTMAEMQRRAGFQPVSPGPKSPDPVPEAPAGDILLQVSEDNYPKSFDWRQKDGQNYIDAVVDQGSCGACYAHSSLSMINSRIRIATKNRVKPSFSVGQILSCNRYSQGCAGGFPYLVEKYAQEFGLTKSGSCAKSSKQLEAHRELGEDDEAEKHDPFVRVSHYGYVGGYYGGTRTAQMMHEVYHNGPIVVGLNGGFELMHYESGIFIQTGEGEGKIRNDFESVSHAVMVVGWGEHGKDKYWILKNSFGANWGENGYFRIPRGGDADGITSLVTYAKPVLVMQNISKIRRRMPSSMKQRQLYKMPKSP